MVSMQGEILISIIVSVLYKKPLKWPFTEVCLQIYQRLKQKNTSIADFVWFNQITALNYKYPYLAVHCCSI